MSFITTFTGKKIDPLHLKEEDVCLEDLIVGLSNRCRFGCQLPVDKFYSVSQHSVLVSNYCYNNAPKSERKGVAIAALGHDFVEALSPLGDIPSPRKDQIGVYAFKKFMNVRSYEDEATKIIFRALKIDKYLPYLFKNNILVHYYDKVLCASESIQLRDVVHGKFPTIKEKIIPLNTVDSYNLFLNRWEFLTK